MLRLLAFLFLSLLSLPAAGTPAGAATPDLPRTLAQFAHTAWTDRDGLSGPVYRLAQTRDGHLWLATAQGLVRFDGVRFEHVQRLDGQEIGSEAVRDLDATPTGGFWFNGARGVGHYEGGRLRTYDKRTLHGMRSATTTSDGQVWLTTTDFETWLISRDGQPTRIDGTRGLPEHARVSSGLVDGRGTLWLSGDLAIHRLAAGADTFQTFSSNRGGKPLLAPDGSVWFSNSRGVVAVAPDAATLAQARLIPAPGYETMHIDTSGGIWDMTRAPGARQGSYVLQHFADWRDFLRPQGPLDYRDTMGAHDGLSNPAIRDILEDREGNVWTASNAGIDRFRRLPFVPVAVPGMPVQRSLASAPGGAVWTADFDNPVRRVGLHDVQGLHVDAHMNLMLRARGGRVWAAGTDGIWSSDADAPFARLSDSPFGPDGPYPLSMAEDADGRPWLCSDTGLARWSGRRWEPQALAGLPGARVRALHADARGRLWFGLDDGRVAVRDAVREQGALRLVATDGSAVGALQTFDERGPHLWFGALHGAGLLVDGATPRVLQAADGRGFERVTGLRELASGALWLHVADHAARIAPEELRHWLADPSHAVRVQRFGPQEGLPGSTRGGAYGSTLAEADDGALWFSTSAGLFRLDPARLESAAPALEVLVDELSVDGHAVVAAGEPALPPSPRRVSFAFTAPELGQPERVRFRYRLDGLDTDWQEAGAVRSADYTSLPPGDYRFRVAARVGDASWSEPGASLAFSVQPAWYQTSVARVAGALAFGALWIAAGWAFHALRARRLAERERLRFEAQQAERDRIARELHDTLLQSAQGLILHFQGAVAQISPGHEAVRERLDRSLDVAGDVLREARDRVLDLRSRPLETMSLHEALALDAPERGAGDRVEFIVRPIGTPRALRPDAREACYRAAREAVWNAFLHAGARHIAVSVNYARSGLEIVVRDDGGGIPADVLSAGGRPGHLGLPGMRERVGAIGGSITISAQAGAGSTVVIKVPARAAYGKQAATAS